MAAALTVTAGAVTFTVNLDSSSDASASVSVQANVDIGQAVSELLKLGLAGRDNIVNGGSDSPVDCAHNSTGEVQEFLIRDPCKEYSTALIKVHKKGISTQAVISWVAMPSSDLAVQYKDIVDEIHQGNPPGQPPSVFNGSCYASGQYGDVTWVAQVQPTGHIAVDRLIIQAVAPVKLSENYLGIHCIG